MPDKSSPLYDLRCRIDELDNQLLNLLAERYKILAEVVKVKEKNGISHYVQSRVDEVLDRNAAKGKVLGLPENYVRDLWQRMIDEAHVFEGRALGQTEKDRDYDVLTSKHTKTTKSSDDISKDIVDAAFKVHQSLGVGLLESAYEECLFYELTNRGFFVERQKILPIEYEGVKIESGYRIDLMIERDFIIEVKSVDKIAPIHQAQLMTYLKLASVKTGLLINFNTKMFKDGIKRLSV